MVEVSVRFFLFFFDKEQTDIAAVSTHNGVNQHLKDSTQVQQQRPELATVTLT